MRGSAHFIETSADGTPLAQPAVRHRLGDALPAMLVDDPFVQRFCDGLDAVVAPASQAIDNFQAYIDPALTPPDFLEWLATWVGIDADRSWSVERTRAVVAEAHRVLRRRGTAGGLADLVELVTGVRPEIVEGGAVAWSQTPDAPLPGSGDHTVVVRLALVEPAATIAAKLDALVGANKPAHLTHRVEYVPPEQLPSKPPAKPASRPRSAGSPPPPPPSGPPPPPPPGPPPEPPTSAPEGSS